jgi:MFS family permease
MRRNPALTTVFLVVLVDLMGFGLVLPLLPFYASDFHASDIQIGILYSIFSAAQLIFSPLWGSLSDRFGRRPIMLLSTFGAAVSYVMFGLADSYWMLLVSRAIAGIMGGNISAAQAYIADVTKPEERAAGMGLIGAAFGLGFVIGPAAATALLHPSFPSVMESLGASAFSQWVLAHKLEAPGFFAALLSFISFLLVVFKLPESVKEGATYGSARKGIFSADFWRQFAPGTSASPVIALLFAGTLFIWIGQGTMFSAFPMFCERKLGMSPDKVGIQFFYIGIFTAVMQGFLLRMIAKRFSEKNLFLSGTILNTIAMFSYVVVDSQAALLVSLFIMATGNSLIQPSIASLISKEAKPEEVGSLLGTSQSVAGLGRVIGPAWGGFWISFGVNMPFLITGFILLPAIWMAVRLKRKTV